MNRRGLLKSVFGLPVLLGLSKLARASQPLSLATGRRVPVLQGFTDATSALVNVLGRPGWTFQINARTPGHIRYVEARALAPFGRTLYMLQLDSLSLVEPTELLVYDENGRLADTRALRGLDLAQSSPRIAVMSCANYREVKGQENVWSRVHELGTQLILFAGDTAYATTLVTTVIRKPETPTTALEHYIATWDTVGLYALDPLVPTLATWDDHDYGMNNGGADHPYRAEMTELFRAFFPLPDRHHTLHKGPGIAFRWTAFGIDFHVMDSRSFFESGLTQWGRKQEIWFKRDFLSSPRPAWLINGTQFFKYFPLAESIERSSPRTHTVLTTIVQAAKKPVAFFSGDVHYSQVQKLESYVYGFESFEFTASAVHSSSPSKWMRRSLEEGQLFFQHEPNFLAVRPLLAPRAMSLAIACATHQGVQRLEDIYTIKI